MKATVGIVDDHALIAKALAILIDQLERYRALFDVCSGKELFQILSEKDIPDIILLDISIPVMNGYEIAKYLKENYPQIKVIALSMNDKEEAIIQMLRNGVRGYLIKGCSTLELKSALDAVIGKGFYYSEFLTAKLVQSLGSTIVESQRQLSELSKREIEFIRHACSELTYAEIADRLCVSPRTVDGYRESIFSKFNVKTRVGLVLEAVRLKIITV